MIALFSEVARRLWQTDKLEWEYLPAKADLVLVPPERHLPVPADFSFSTFLPRSPLYEELDLPTAENEADPWPLCFWQVTLKVFSSYHFGQLPFPCVALYFLGNIALVPLKNTSSWLVFGFATCWSQVEQEVHPPISRNWWKSMRSDGFFGAVGTIWCSLRVYWCSLLTELQGFSGQCHWIETLRRVFVGLPSRFSPGDLGKIF